MYSFKELTNIAEQKSKRILAILVLSAIAGFPTTALALSKKPNILLILLDQLRWDAVGYAGNHVVSTPNIDRLAEEGVSFTRAYTQMAVCAPARAAIMTGHSVENNGVVSNQHTLNPKLIANTMPMPTLDEILAEQYGYTVEYYGKWHAALSRADVFANSGDTDSQGRSVFSKAGQKSAYREYLKIHVPQRDLRPGEFRERYSKRPYTPSPIDTFYGHPANKLPGPPKRREPDMHGVTSIPAKHSITAYQARQTIAALRENKDNRFAITLAFHSPHAPMLPPLEYARRYEPKEMPMPASLKDSMETSPYRLANNRSSLPQYTDEEKLGYMIAAYYALVEEVDFWIGETLSALEEEGLAHNTLVIFTSDHGEMLGAHGMRGKNTFYEEASRIPLVIRLPGVIPAGSVVDGYVSNMDIFATVLDYIGVGAHPSDGSSLRPLIEQRPSDHGQFVVSEWLWPDQAVPNFMILEDGWKLMVPAAGATKGKGALYDLNSDPFEMNNLLAAPAAPETKKRIIQLISRLEAWLERTGSSYQEVSSKWTSVTY